MNKCLYCYKELNGETDYHQKCSVLFFGTKTAPQIPYSLGQMHDLAKNVIERSIAVPGVQAKLSMALEKVGAEQRFTVIGALGGNYIFKPPSDEYPALPQNEHVTMRIAEAFGIKVVPSSLIKLASGELSYITKRIDRTDNGQKIHMLDMFQITEAFDKYKSSMEKVGKAIGAYSENTLLDKLFFFELTLFSFLTGNNDMHLKNFSLIESASGWALAPAYDLLNVSIANPKDEEELALTLLGKKKRFAKHHFEEFGLTLGLSQKQVDSVFKRFIKNKSKAIDWVDNSFLSDEMKVEYNSLLEERYLRMV